jgi:hypothetical protein
MPRRKRPTVIQLENGEFEFGPGEEVDQSNSSNKRRKIDIDDDNHSPSSRNAECLRVPNLSSKKEKQLFVASKVAGVTVTSDIITMQNNSNTLALATDILNSSQSTESMQSPKVWSNSQPSAVAERITMEKVNSDGSEVPTIVLAPSPDVVIVDANSPIVIMDVDSHFSYSGAPNTGIEPVIVELFDEDNIGDFEEIVSPATEIFTILPDADPKDVDRLLLLYQNHVESVLQHMFEKGYEKLAKMQAPQVTEAKQGDELGNKDFTSSMWETSSEYRSNAINELTNNFPFLRPEGIQKLFRAQKYHYYHALKRLEEITGIPADFNFRDSFSSSKAFSREIQERVRNSLEEKDPKSGLQTRGLAKALPFPLSKLEPCLHAEIVWICKQKQQETEQIDKKFAEELNYQMAAVEKALIECGCCFTEYPFEQIVQCTEAHLFCKQCLQHYAEQTLFGDGRTTLKCMSAVGEPCPGFFTESMLRASLSEKVLAKFSEAQTRDVLKAAQIDDLVTCFECQYQVSMAEDAGKIMHCPHCKKDTCRECGDEAHIPLKCSEVEKKGDTANRLTVEEALTQARIRACPKCKTKFYKIEGCNKMTCSCGINICYVCRKDITKEKYKHFCQIPHCTHNTCNRCKLYTNSVEDDIQAMREAGLKAIEEVTSNDLSSSSDKADSTNTVQLIDLNKYLETVPGKTAVNGAQPGLRFPIPPAPPMLPMPPVPPIPLNPRAPNAAIVVPNNAQPHLGERRRRWRRH